MENSITITIKFYHEEELISKKEMEEFNAYMSNDGENAKEFGRKLCKGLDDAFPLK